MSERSDKPYQTSYEVPVDLPGLSVDVVVHHGPLEMDAEAFWESAVDEMNAERVELVNDEIRAPLAVLNGIFTAEQLLGVYIMLKQAE